MKTCSECTWLNVKYRGTSCLDTGILPMDTPCKQFRSMSEDLVHIKKAYIDSNIPVDIPWLPKNFSKAFMVCIGAGPWKFSRRQTVQGQALAWLGDRELEQLSTVDCYPLAWQNSTVTTLAAGLRRLETTMEAFCIRTVREAVGDPAGAKRRFYSLCGNPEGFKVLSLFCRDALKIEAFPIDRHVARRLDMYKLPKSENALVYLCDRAGLDVQVVAKSFVHTGDGESGLDRGNPSWV